MFLMTAGVARRGSAAPGQGGCHAAIVRRTLSQLPQISERVRWWLGLPGVAAWVWSWISRRVWSPQRAAPQQVQIATAGVVRPSPMQS
jgi:hypothetical protein